MMVDNGGKHGHKILDQIRSSKEKGHRATRLFTILITIIVTVTIDQVETSRIGEIKLFHNQIFITIVDPIVYTHLKPH